MFLIIFRRRRVFCYCICNNYIFKKNCFLFFVFFLEGGGGEVKIINGIVMICGYYKINKFKYLIFINLWMLCIFIYLVR